MGIENLNRWHWAIIGLLVGVAMGYVWSANQAENEPLTIGEDSFLRELRQSRPDGEPRLTNLTIGQEVEDYRGKKVVPVTMDRWVPADEEGKVWKATRVELTSSIPFSKRANAPKQNTIRDYLATEMKRNPKITFAEDRAKNMPFNLAVFGIGGLVVIGGVWPTLLNVLTGAGYGKVREAKVEKPVYASEPSTAAVLTGRAAMTRDDEAELAALNARLEAATSGLAVTENDDEHALKPAARPAEPVIRKLNDSPDPVRAAAVKDEGPKDFTGEFYPVAKPAVKRH